MPPAQSQMRSGAAGAVVNWIGAALSLALLVGVSVWSYRLMVRDVSGVPVVQALAGPMRVAPDDPGGRRAAHQGLAVNAVAAEGLAAPASDTITLAPAPVVLEHEDRVALQRPAQAEAAPPERRPSQGADGAGQASGESQSSPERAGDPGRLPETVLARSPVPPRRPGGLRATPAVASSGSGQRVTNVTYDAGRNGRDDQAEALLEQLATRLAPSSHADIDPQSLQPGTRLVQLGAYDDEAEARAAWVALADRFPAQFDGRGRVIEEATAGGRSFFRLRAHGFTDEPEARRFCAAFAHEGVDCIPVLVR
ncbi:MAG: SPOR domain-containing protein [Pararhodobacter sp.]|nr:SPOR domain-containing protein [Pararhodobacter sp.]